MQKQSLPTSQQQQTYAQPVSKQQLLWKDSPQITAEHDIKWYGIFLWSVWVSSPSCIPSQPLGHPQSIPGVKGQSEKQKRPWHSASTTQQLQKTGSVTTTVTSIKDSTTPAAVGKVSSIPTRPSAPSKLQTALEWNCSYAISMSGGTARLLFHLLSWRYKKLNLSCLKYPRSTLLKHFNIVGSELAQQALLNCVPYLSSWSKLTSTKFLAHLKNHAHNN